MVGFQEVGITIATENVFFMERLVVLARRFFCSSISLFEYRICGRVVSQATNDANRLLPQARLFMHTENEITHQSPRLELLWTPRRDIDHQSKHTYCLFQSWICMV